MGMDRNGVILIPTLNPGAGLVEYVRELITNGFKQIIIVNDGSGQSAEDIFGKIGRMGQKYGGADIKILTHAINLGKGRGLKTGINYYLCHRGGKYAASKGLISVDSDGQHLVKDVMNIDRQLQQSGGVKAVILGCRDFSLDGIPPKSRFGNKLTKLVFRLCFGENIEDTQTGLRGITNEALPDLVELYGERFEYETNVLIECVRKKIAILQIGIETIYEDNNSGTHFNPITDSIKIYRLILKRFFLYMLASLSSFVIDCALFGMLCRVFAFTDNKIWIATVGARLVSSFYNYMVNKNVVFEYGKKGKRTFFMYGFLCVATMLFSGFAVNALYNVIGHNEILIKCLVDTILFLLNYYIQRKFIFND